MLDEGPLLLLHRASSEPFDLALTAFGDTNRASASLMFVPVCNRGRTVGVLSIQSYTPDAYTHADLTTLQALAHQCGSALERIEAQEALLASEAELRAVFAAMTDVILVLDKDGRYRKIAPTNPSLLYRPPAELIGKTLHEVMPAAEADAFLGHIHRALATRGPVSTEYCLSIDGQDTWFAGTVTPMLDDAVVYVARDITERKRAEETRTRLAAIVESSADAIVSKALDGTILSWNAGAERLYGYAAAEALGRPFAILIPPDRPQEVVHILQKMGPGERVAHHETVRLRKDGTLVDVAVTDSPIRNASGQVIGISAIARDITERKQVDRMKNEFISTVSHELRTPLTSIRGSLGLIAGGVAGELPPRAKAMVEIAYTNSERLVRLINDILDIEKIESGKMVFNLQPLDLMGLIEQALEANRGYGEQFRVRFALAEALPGVKVNADSDRLMQVLTNLLSNAAKFSPPDDTVVVAVTRQNQRVRVAVRDHGPGIPEEFQSRIFQKFAQADSSDTRQKGGTGLGLSIVKAIVEKHGGEIDFVTARNQGTTFYVDLPEWQEPAAVAIDAPVHGQAPRILVCEDDRDIATLLRLTLAEGGFATDIAYDAAHAKELLASTAYVAMTLDLNLPDQDGIALLRELRGQEATRSLPIIVVSVAAQLGRDELCGDAFGIVDWLDKPIDTTRLVKAVQWAVRSTARHTPRILHVEDDPDIVQVIATLLETVTEVVPAMSLDEAERRLEQERFDLVLLDVGLPDGSGLQVLPLIGSRIHPAVPVMLFSAQEVPVETAEQIAAVLVKSRTSNQQLLDTITSLAGCPGARHLQSIPAHLEA